MFKNNSLEADYLFVYGTLMRNFNNPVANEMLKYSTFIGKGFVNAIMYEVSSYPCIDQLGNTSKKVYGEVYEINDFKKIFLLLDSYEECDSSFSKPHEYRRVVGDTYLNNEIKKTWLYVYNLPTNSLVPIESGDYYKFAGI